MKDMSLLTKSFDFGHEIFSLFRKTEQEREQKFASYF